MPVSTGQLGEPRAKRCKHCDESSHRSESGAGYWQLQLDPDLVETISAIYPEWFKTSMAEGVGSGGAGGGGGGSGAGVNGLRVGSTGVGTQSAPTVSRESPPKAIVDSSPLLNSLEQNKESLKVKLMLRRPVEQLVAQGIMPPLKTPAAYHGQRKQLERAKTGDLLKTKIQQRPSRVELESRHILESDHVDPSIAEKQRMLKKARLADQLNDQLSHRPGPLELIQKNILHTEEPIEHAVKAGKIPYKATCEGQLNRPQHPLSYVNPEDDSQSSEDNNVSTTSPSPDVLETAVKSAEIVVVSLIPTKSDVCAMVVSPPKDNSDIFADLCRSVAEPLLKSVPSPASLVSSTSSTLSPLSSSIPSPIPLIVSPSARLTRDAPGKDKNRKKCKSKTTPKTRTIKFHEYKGPPSAQKNSNSNSSPGESSYDLLLQQQTLLLQFQLQLQHKYPQIILPATAQKAENSPSPSPSINSDSSTPKILTRLEDMKVSDLKAELKRRNLPVSGSKPQLIERLKSSTNNPETMSDDSQLEATSTSTNSPLNEEPAEQMEICEMKDPTSPKSPDQLTQEEIVREQRRKIEELQRELQLSQLKLQAATCHPNPKFTVLQKQLQTRQQNQFLQMQALHLQNRQNEQEAKLLQQQQHVAFQNQKNLTNNLILNETDATLVLNHFNGLAKTNKLINGHARTHSLPNLGHAVPSQLLNPTDPIDIKKNNNNNGLSEMTGVNVTNGVDVAAANASGNAVSNVKSQIVDDVLEILIKNGELPPSAAQDPSTPGTGSKNNAEPAYSPEAALGLDTSDILDSLDTLENMDFSQLIELGQQNNNLPVESAVPMETDDWLDSLLPSEVVHSTTGPSLVMTSIVSDGANGLRGGAIAAGAAPSPSSLGSELSYDPLLAIGQDPFDPFCLDDLRSQSELSWDKVDFTA